MTPRDTDAGAPIGPDDPRLTAWALGETDHLDADTMRAIAAAVARDPALAAEVEALRAFDADLLDALGPPPVEALTPAERAALLSPPAAAAPVVSLDAARRRRGRWIFGGAGAVAAAAALVLVAVPASERAGEAPAALDQRLDPAVSVAPTAAPDEAAAPEADQPSTVATEANAEAGSATVTTAAEKAPVTTSTPGPAPDPSEAPEAEPAVAAFAQPRRPVEAKWAEHSAVSEANPFVFHKPAVDPWASSATAQPSGGATVSDLASSADATKLVTKKTGAKAKALSRYKGDAKDNAWASGVLAVDGEGAGGGGTGSASGAGLGIGRLGDANAAAGEDVGGAFATGRSARVQAQLRGIGAGKGGLIARGDMDLDAYDALYPYDDYYWYQEQARRLAEAARWQRTPYWARWPFKVVSREPLSTFSLDVDTASMSHARRYLLSGRRVPAHLVRVEEIVNALRYDDPPPEEGAPPIAVHVAVADAPWNAEHRLARVAVSTRGVPAGDRPPANLVFLVDVSGSMAQKAKLPLLKTALTRLVDELREDDRVAIITYNSKARVVLEPTPVGDRVAVLRALRKLRAGGYTNGGVGLDKAYELARRNYDEGGLNRVILATDGEFNSGKTSVWQLQRDIAAKARSGVALSVLGFGKTGFDDRRLEALAQHGDGRYAFIDSLAEAERVLVDELDATLVTAAKDVRIQVELNPTQARSYRLVGYENRTMAAHEFNQEGKDAAELGAGESIVAFYEIVPVTVNRVEPNVDALKYQPSGQPAASPPPAAEVPVSQELMTVKVRWVPVEGGRSQRFDVPVVDRGERLADVGPDFQLSAAAAAFGLKLQSFGDPYRQITWGMVRELTEASSPSPGPDAERLRFLELVDAAADVYGGP